jgi:hypothetical protein
MSSKHAPGERRPARVPQASEKKIALPNIEALISDHGDITVGHLGPIRCAAFAADEHQQLAALIRHDGESLIDLLRRLDAAIEQAWNNEIFIDEINT